MRRRPVFPLPSLPMVTALLLVAVIAACANGTLDRPSISDPRNANAPETPVALATSTSTGTPLPPSPAAVMYTCPMHPEVQSDKPGTCPKCGMKLVPQTKP